MNRLKRAMEDWYTGRKLAAENRSAAEPQAGKF